MTQKLNELELAAACRSAYKEFSAVPVLDLLAVAVGYELATPGDTERRGSVFIQHAMTIIGWGLAMDDAMLAALARRAVTPAYIPGPHLQDRYAVRRKGVKDVDVLVLRTALTPSEIAAIEQGRLEIERRGMWWEDPELVVVLDLIRGESGAQ